MSTFVEIVFLIGVLATALMLVLASCASTKTRGRGR